VVQNVELELSLHIGQVGCSSLAFAHGATWVSDGAVTSRSRTVMVWLGPDEKPAAGLESIRMLVQPVEMPRVLDSPGEPPADAWVRTIQVRPSDLDALQHVASLVQRSDALARALRASVLGWLDTARVYTVDINH
jgi:hypothetical protein